MATPYPPVLGAHQFLRGLPEQHVARLAAWARSIRLADRERLFEEGGTADRFWLIQAGQIALDSLVPGRGHVIVEHLGRGDVVGLSWLFPPYRWGFGAVATQPLQAFEVDAKAVRAECARDTAFGREITERFLHVTLHRLQATRNRLVDLSGHPELLP
ncbi:MAG TPA: cyclic nucleotide-binding domain-containing protein [Streptosporangiaceae bacterium]|nr:cyclic nucleotide-binding domain-containing protein [Streptosporangiaceae bacterium]